jgi:hypothetical protein
MSGPIGYVLGYDAGRSDAEISRQRREIVDRIFYGTRNVEVDQSYIDRLHAAFAAANASSDHNYDAADRFRNEAFEWKAYAQGRENLVAPLKAQLSALQAHLAERDAAFARADAALARERAAHQLTREEKWGLNLFRLMATWLIEAHSAGRSDRPEFAELRDMAKDVTDAIQRGNPFRGYRDEPQKKARLQALLEELLRP